MAPDNSMQLLTMSYIMTLIKPLPFFVESTRNTIPIVHHRRKNIFLMKTDPFGPDLYKSYMNTDFLHQRHSVIKGMYAF